MNANLRILVCQETDTSPAVYLRRVTQQSVEIELRGEAHRLPWPLLNAAADQIATDPQTVDMRGRYAAVRDAAYASLSPHERRRWAIDAMVADGVAEKISGDVAAEAETAAALDYYVGRWVNGEWVGGQAMINAAYEASRLSALFGGA